MHAFLITGGTKKDRAANIDALVKDRDVSPFDRITVKNEDGAIGVVAVREFTKKLSLAPFGGKTLAGIIEDAHTLTIEAQNALLKTLEEPGKKVLVILEATASDLLLPTITSRCQILFLGVREQYSEAELSNMQTAIQQIEEARIGEKITAIDRIVTDREAAKLWIDQAIAASRISLLTEQSSQSAKRLRKLQTAQRQLSANVTPKLVLDAIFFNS